MAKTILPSNTLIMDMYADEPPMDLPTDDSDAEDTSEITADNTDKVSEEVVMSEPSQPTVVQQAPDRATESENDVVSESVVTETDTNQDSGTTDTQAELKPKPKVVQGDSSAEILESDGEVSHNPTASAKFIFNKLNLSNSPSPSKRRSRRAHSALSRRSRSVSSPPRS